MFAVDNIENRILIVDDESEIRELLSDFFGDSYECVQADSAESALAEIKRQSFAVVISDVCLPGMTGLEMIPQIAAQSPEPPVIVISGQQTIDDAIHALRAGAFDYILKPFDLLQVEAAVRRAAEHFELKVIKRRYDLHLEELVAERTAELDQALDEVENSYRSTLKALVQALETRDFETHGHSERVVTFSLRLAYELDLDDKQMRSLEFGAMLHDIGKIGVPDAVLRKPAALNDAEWAKMRLHPLHGQQILRGIPFLEGAIKLVAQHHEKWDGTGYPLGLKGEEIDLNARIFAVVDAFDAIVSDRVYRAGRSYEEALAEIERCSGKQFDPEVVAAFRRVPREDWETLRRRSLMRKPEHFSYQSVVAELLNSKTLSYIN
ncbi:MAG TPA: HD domain-containing phosphohydrolase [Pyrinomonadaceae bacterium]|jgi:response regulator RpfG family c-di-GMP phosphodiesterase